MLFAFPVDILPAKLLPGASSVLISPPNSTNYEYWVFESEQAIYSVRNERSSSNFPLGKVFTVATETVACDRALLIVENGATTRPSCSLVHVSSGLRIEK